MTAHPRPGGSAHAHPATILLVDSVATSLSRSRAALEGAGHCVLATGFGASAILLGEDHRGGIDVVVADAVLSLVSGVEVIRTLRRHDPAIVAILVARPGWNVDREAASLGATVLRRPLRGDHLVRAVEDALGRRP